MTALSERVRRDAQANPPRPSDSGIFTKPNHGREDAHVQPSRQGPGVRKAGPGSVPSARERAALIWSQAHEATGTSSAVTARHLEIGDRMVRKMGSPEEGKPPSLAHVIAAPSAIRAHVGEQLVASTVEIPPGRTEEHQIHLVMLATIGLGSAREDASKERAIAELGREIRILRAIRAGRCP